MYEGLSKSLGLQRTVFLGPKSLSDEEEGGRERDEEEEGEGRPS